MKIWLLLTTLILFLSFANAQQPATVIVSPEHTVKLTDSVVRKSLKDWSDSLNKPNFLYAIQPSSINFPGLPKPDFTLLDTVIFFHHTKADTDQYKTSLKFIFSSPEAYTMYSTGLYAVAGKPIDIRLPSSFNGKEVFLFIGSHTDNLYDDYSNGEDWRRMPRVFSLFKLDSSVHFVSSPFGGLIYLATRPITDNIDGKIHLSNVIVSPFYKSGVTSSESWKKQLSNNKAPWGEIASDKIIITLPDSALQKIDDPSKVLAVWDKILDTEYQLSQLPCPFIRPVRLVVDEHMSTGYMHAGYPIMIHHSPAMHMLSLDVITDPNKLLQPNKGGANWGFFHEIGHNLQNWEWVFDGTIEVGCNLYTLYVFDSLIGTRKDAIQDITQEWQQKAMQEYFSKGTQYKDWQESPFLALIPFIEIQKKFGWNAFKHVFRLYIDKPTKDFNIWNPADSNYNKINQQKIDLFVVRFSEEVRTNLAPFWRAWGVPVSKTVDTKLKRYLMWIPDEMKTYMTH